MTQRDAFNLRRAFKVRSRGTFLFFVRIWYYIIIMLNKEYQKIWDVFQYKLMSIRNKRFELVSKILKKIDQARINSIKEDLKKYE